MRRRAASVGPFRIIERRRPHQFQVREGHALISTHANFQDAEDAALRYWLRPKPKGQAAETGEIDRAEG
jgi:hypothetical protein